MTTKTAICGATSREFQKYDREHPDVYDAFKQSAQYMKNVERLKSISVSRIVQDMRDNYIDSNDNPIRVGNRFLPFYARKLVRENPKFKGFLTFTKRTR